MELGADELLVLSERARNSRDSRRFGPVARAAILGEVCYRYWPPSRRGGLD